MENGPRKFFFEIPVQRGISKKNLYGVCSYKDSRGVTGGWAGWVIAHPVFGRIEGAARQQQRGALLLVHPVLGSHLRP